MMGDFFLVSALTRDGGVFGSGIGGLYAPLVAVAASRTTLAQSTLSQSLEDSEAKVSGYDGLLDAVSNFQSTLKNFDAAGDINTSVAASSDASVANASAEATAGSGVFDLIVTDLARAQTTVSGVFADSDTTVVGTGTITIEIGEYDSGSNTFTPGASGPVAINIAGGTLDEIAASINAAGAGVTASVVQNGNDFHLSVVSFSTGAANGFALTVTDDDGNNTDTGGLSQIAFDPTAGAGAGRNLTETVAARDAAFTINGIASTSAENSGITISPGVTVNLLQSGGSTITISKDPAALASSAQDFVAAFNDLNGIIDDLTGAGGALKDDQLAAQLIAALKTPLSEDLGASGSLDFLHEIGITPQADGALGLDEAKLQSAFAGDATGAVALLNKAATAFDAIVDPYTRGGGTIEGSAKAFQHNARYLGSLIPALQQMGALNQQYTAAQTTSALLQIYGASINENVFDSFSSRAFSKFA